MLSMVFIHVGSVASRAKTGFYGYCFDRKEPSFRNDMYPEYKTNREQMPEDLVPQLPYLKKLRSYWEFPVWIYRDMRLMMLLEP